MSVRLILGSSVIAFLMMLSYPASAAGPAPTCKGKTATIYVENGVIVGGDQDGDSYAGSLEGTHDDDVIVGTTGSDEIDAGIGDDTVCGNGGDDEISGGNGDDLLCGEAGGDSIDGGNGDDTLCGEDGEDTLEAGNGDDQLDGGAGTDVLDAENGSDVCTNGETTSNCEATGTVSSCGGSGGGSSVSSSGSSTSSAGTSSGGSSSGGTSSGGSSMSSTSSSGGSSVSSGASSAGSSVSGGSSTSGGSASSGGTSSASSQGSAGSGGSSSVGGGGSTGGTAFGGFTFPEVNDGNGGHLGERTNVAFGIIRFMAAQKGITARTAPPAFGGTDDTPLSDAEIDYICSLQRSFPWTTSRAFVYKLAEKAAERMGRDVEFIHAQLRDRELCVSINALLLPKQTVSSAEPIVFPLGEDGLPISSNPSWNAFIRGSVDLVTVRSNPDKDRHGNGRDSSYYHTGSLWRHPDLSMYFTFDRPTGSVHLPEGFIAVREVRVAAQ